MSELFEGSFSHAVSSWHYLGHVQR